MGIRIIFCVFSIYCVWLSCVCWLICCIFDKNIWLLDLIFIDLILWKMYGLVSSSDFKFLYCLILLGNLFNLIIRLYYLYVFNFLLIFVLMYVFGDCNIELVLVGFLNIKVFWFVMEFMWFLDLLIICILFYGFLFVFFCFVLLFCIMLLVKIEFYLRIKSFFFYIFIFCFLCYVFWFYCNFIKFIVIINY